MDETIDWRSIFKEYLKHVADSEGTDFLGDWDEPPVVVFASFTLSEAEAVAAAATEARKELSQRTSPPSIEAPEPRT
jgi:hypothetical protein